MDEFDQQARAFTEQVEAELHEGRLVFPVSMEVSLRIKRLVDDPHSNLEQLVAVIQAEPVLAAKAIRMANTVALNPYRAQVDSIGVAIRRIGLTTLRGLALAVASEQLAGDHRSPNMRTLGYGLWLRSVDIASWCFALARSTRTTNPDTALLAGMMTHIGQFLLLARASDYPEMERSIDRFAGFVEGLHHRVGIAVLEVFNVPETILDGLDDDAGYAGHWPPLSLHDIVQIAARVSEHANPFNGLLGRNSPSGLNAAAELGIDPVELKVLLEDAHDERQQILDAVRG